MLSQSYLTFFDLSEPELELDKIPLVEGEQHKLRNVLRRPELQDVSGSEYGLTTRARVCVGLQLYR